MRIESICERLQDIIYEKRQLHGRVHSVFRSACNICLDDAYFITLLSGKRYIYPMSMLIEDSENTDFRELNIKQDSVFYVDPQEATFVDNGIKILMGEVSFWSPEPTLPLECCDEVKLLKNIEMLELALSLYGKGAGIGTYISRLGKYFPELKIQLFLKAKASEPTAFIMDRLLELIGSVAAFRSTNIDEYGEKVIGFGAGLTPSVDDFISGLMISFVYASKYYNLNTTSSTSFNKKLISKGEKTTTKISWEMLKHSADGKTSECMKKLMHALFSQQGSEVLNAAKCASAVGETSGTDTMLGIYIGLRIMTNIKNRRLWLNEFMYRN